MAPITAQMRYPVALIFINSIMITMAALAICLRLWSRRMKRTFLQFNDYIILVAWLLSIALIILMNYAITHGGVGQPLKNVSMAELTFALKMFVPISIFGSLAVSAVKISAIQLFITIFPNKMFHLIAYMIMGLTGCYGFSFAVVSLASCKPFAFNWDKNIPSGTCINTSSFFTTQTIIGALLDFIVVALPMPMLWGLKLKWQKKIALTCIFGMGILICVISSFRAILNSKATYLKTNFPSYAALAILLGSLEVTLSMISACLPVMQPVLNKVSYTLKSTFSKDKNSTPEATSTWPSKQPQRILPFCGSDEAKFKRLNDHLYPMSQDDTTQLSYGGGTKSTIVGADGGEGLDRDLELNDLRHLRHDLVHPHSLIAVTRGWDVSSVP